MNRKPVFVSYYTPEYAGVADRLRKSLNRFDCEYMIERRPSKHNWIANTFQKIDAITDAAFQLPERRIVWIDADAEIVAEPAWFSQVSDDVALAAHRFQWTKNHPVEFLSGTLYFGVNEHRLAYLQAVKKMMTDFPNRHKGDQEYFNDVLLSETFARDLAFVFVNLPRGYCQINNAQRETPVFILHHQASRLLRGRVNSGDTAQ